MFSSYPFFIYSQVVLNIWLIFVSCLLETQFFKIVKPFKPKLPTLTLTELITNDSSVRQRLGFYMIIRKY